MISCNNFTPQELYCRLLLCTYAICLVDVSSRWCFYQLWHILWLGFRFGMNYGKEPVEVVYSAILQQQHYLVGKVARRPISDLGEIERKYSVACAFNYCFQRDKCNSAILLSFSYQTKKLIQWRRRVRLQGTFQMLHDSGNQSQKCPDHMPCCDFHFGQVSYSMVYRRRLYSIWVPCVGIVNKSSSEIGLQSCIIKLCIAT